MLDIYSHSKYNYSDDLTFNAYSNLHEEHHFFYFKTVTIEKFIKQTLFNPLNNLIKLVGEEFN